MQYANREGNAIMTIAKCTNTAVSSNDSDHHSSTPPLGSLMVLLITGDAIRISGVGYLFVAIPKRVYEGYIL